MAISRRYWASLTEGRVKLQRRSENSMNSDHVLKIVYDQENQFITGVVKANMRNMAYKVTVSRHHADTETGR